MKAMKPRKAKTHSDGLLPDAPKTAGESASTAAFVTVAWRRAKEIYADFSNNDIELDHLEHYIKRTPCARISEDDDGVWVQAWVWVPREEGES